MGARGTPSARKALTKKELLKEILAWMAPISVIIAVLAGFYVAWPTNPPAAARFVAQAPPGMDMTPVLPEGVGEQAPYRVEGDTVFVNNRICAVSHSPLDPHNLDRFVSRVKYNGPIAKFKGKTLLFNQCCEMCIQNFPSLWKSERDAVLRFHGLTLNN